MARNRRTTIADVAKAAGVAPGTVSKVLNQKRGDVRISDATRRHVLETAERMGYRANPFASALRTRRTGLMGLVVRDISDPFLNLVARAIQRKAREADVDVLIGNAEYDVAAAGRQIAVMYSHWFDGVVLLGDIAGEEALAGELERLRTPSVAVACGQSVPIDSVDVDEEVGVRLAAEHLRQLGHTDIAIIGSTDHVGLSSRLEHSLSVLAGTGFRPPEDWVRIGSHQRSTGAAAMRALMALHRPPTAVMCATDLLAMGALSGAVEAGAHVPAHVSVIGFDDIDEAVTYPGLTTIRQPADEMAAAAVSTLMRRIADEEGEHDRVAAVIEPRLMQRGSCAAPRPRDA